MSNLNAGDTGNKTASLDSAHASHTGGRKNSTGKVKSPAPIRVRIRHRRSSSHMITAGDTGKKSIQLAKSENIKKSIETASLDSAGAKKSTKKAKSPAPIRVGTRRRRASCLKISREQAASLDSAGAKKSTEKAKSPRRLRVGIRRRRASQHKISRGDERLPILGNNNTNEKDTAKSNVIVEVRFVWHLLETRTQTLEVYIVAAPQGIRAQLQESQAALAKQLLKTHISTSSDGKCDELETEKSDSETSSGSPRVCILSFLHTTYTCARIVF